MRSMTIRPVARDAATAQFLDGTAAGQFLLRHCPACGASSAPQAAQCEQCSATALGWRPATGDATLVSWTVTHGKPGSGVEPVILCIAQLAEGPWWWSRVEDAQPHQMRVGAPLRIEFRRHSPESDAIPVFRIATSGEPSPISAGEHSDRRPGTRGFVTELLGSPRECHD
jgi:uncharacterized protein